MVIHQYTDLEIRLRIGPLFKPCLNMMGARDAWKYVGEMTKILEQSAGLGLAANQVGLDIPIFLIRFDTIQVVYRPKILWMSQKYETQSEACLSLPNRSVLVSRPVSLKAEFIAFPNNKRKTMEFEGLSARVFMHEFDHLKGRTILDN